MLIAVARVHAQNNNKGRLNFDGFRFLWIEIFLECFSATEQCLSGDFYVKGGKVVFITLAAGGGVDASWFAIAIYIYIYPTTNDLLSFIAHRLCHHIIVSTTCIENNMDMSKGRAIELCTVASCRTIDPNKINNNNIEFERKWNVRTSDNRSCTKLNTHRTNIICERSNVGKGIRRKSRNYYVS